MSQGIWCRIGAGLQYVPGVIQLNEFQKFYEFDVLNS